MRIVRSATALFLCLILLLAAVPGVYAAGGEDTESPAEDPSVTYTPVNQIVYALSVVNIRVGPGTDYNIIGVLPYGEAIQRTAIGDNGWSKVNFNGAVAYMHSSLLSTQRPTNTGTSSIDDSSLRRQVAIANGLSAYDYTKESWEQLTEALSGANQALESQSQYAADAAEVSLKNAIAALVRMDYSKLETVLNQISDYVKDDPHRMEWVNLAVAQRDGRALLTSGDQEAVDDAAIRLAELLKQVQAGADAQKQPDVITQEVRVEVPPTTAYCNKPMDRLWPVLFFVSLAVNLGLVVMIITYVSKKRKRQHDDTPLVDYDIYDDTF